MLLLAVASRFSRYCDLDWKKLRTCKSASHIVAIVNFQLWSRINTFRFTWRRVTSPLRGVRTSWHHRSFADVITSIVDRPLPLRGVIPLLENSICNVKPSSAHADYLRMWIWHKKCNKKHCINILRLKDQLNGISLFWAKVPPCKIWRGLVHKLRDGVRY